MDPRIQTPPPQSLPPMANQPGSSKKSLVMILIILAVVLIGGGAAYYFLYYEKDEPAENVNLIVDQNVNKTTNTNQQPVNESVSNTNTLSIANNVDNDWVTFNDPEGNFSVQYPSDYELYSFSELFGVDFGELELTYLQIANTTECIDTYRQAIEELDDNFSGDGCIYISSEVTYPGASLGDNVVNKRNLVTSLMYLGGRNATKEKFDTGGDFPYFQINILSDAENPDGYVFSEMAYTIEAFGDITLVDNVEIIVDKMATSFNIISSTDGADLWWNDTDNDGVYDRYEDWHGTNKNNEDTDGDGYSDTEEIEGCYNPNGSGSMSADYFIATYCEPALTSDLIYQEIIKMQDVSSTELRTVCEAWAPVAQYVIDELQSDVKSITIYNNLDAQSVQAKEVTDQTINNEELSLYLSIKSIVLDICSLTK